MQQGSTSSPAVGTTTSSSRSMRSPRWRASVPMPRSRKCSCEHVRAGKMPSRARKKKLTIKRFAHDYFQRVNYVDIYGRKVGFDYGFILAEIKQQFPAAKTSKTWLRRMAYEIKIDVRMPVRRHSQIGR